MTATAMRRRTFGHGLWSELTSDFGGSGRAFGERMDLNREAPGFNRGDASAKRGWV